MQAGTMQEGPLQLCLLILLEENVKYLHSGSKIMTYFYEMIKIKLDIACEGILSLGPSKKHRCLFCKERRHEMIE